MKIIALMPVRNEVDVLPITLSALEQFCDLIIIADQMSTDGSREVYAQFKKVVVIDNLNKGHSNLVRWQLLEEARKHEGNNFILAVDADEFFSPELFKNFLNKLQKTNPGTFFAFPWIQLWRSLDCYNDGGVWNNNFKISAFIDDRKTNYKKQFIINDHTARVPIKKNQQPLIVKDVPLMHLQYAYWNRTQVKQAWYRCSELINKPKHAFYINQTYAITMDNNSDHCRPVKAEWMNGVELPANLKDLPPGWHLQEILNWFDQYGIEFFEPLQIWQIPQLKEEFIKRVGREPVVLNQEPLMGKIKKYIKSIINLLRGIFQSNLDSYKKHDEQYRTAGAVTNHVERYEKYNSQDLFNNPEYRLGELLDKHPLIRGTVIDLGCGAGWLSARLSKDFSRVIGLEPSADAIAIAKHLYPEEKYPNLEWMVGLAEDKLKTINTNKPILLVTGCVLSHLPNRATKKILKIINLISPVGSIACCSECWGKKYHGYLWHVRTTEWWQKYLPGWEIDFHGPSIENKEDRHKGFHAVKVK